MLLSKINTTASGIILLAGQLLISPDVMAVSTDYHIYSGDYCQADGLSDGPVEHVRGTSYFTRDPVTGLSPGGWMDCPVPRTFKGISAKSNLTVKIAVHDSGDNTAGGTVGVYCELESRPQYSTLNAVFNTVNATTAPTGVAVDADKTLSLSVKPIDSFGHYRLLCYLPPETATSSDSSRVYSYEILETY